MSEEDFRELEDEIKNKRRLPYTLIVEKIEGDLIYTHNQWGNDVVYKKKDGNYYPMTIKDGNQ